MDERFEEACENLSYVEYLADYLTFAEENERIVAVKAMKEAGVINDLKNRLEEKEEGIYAEEQKAA